MEAILSKLLGFSAAPVCICDWTVAWSPQVQVVLGSQGGFHQTAGILLWCELVVGLSLVASIAFGRWRLAAAIVGLGLGFPVLIFLCLFGIDLGQHVLRAGSSELAATCGAILLPALLLGASIRGAWLLVRRNNSALDRSRP
jgi:hypothetical protein